MTQKVVFLRAKPPRTFLPLVMPGDNANIEVNLEKPIAIETGNRFAIREGGKAVGSGVVVEVLD